MAHLEIPSSIALVASEQGMQTGGKCTFGWPAHKWNNELCGCPAPWKPHHQLGLYLRMPSLLLRSPSSKLECQAHSPDGYRTGLMNACPMLGKCFYTLVCYLEQALNEALVFNQKTKKDNSCDTYPFFTVLSSLTTDWVFPFQQLCAHTNSSQHFNFF